MSLLTRHELLILEAIWKFYSVLIRLGCPYCAYKTRHKTRTYHSLKSLQWHIVHEHCNEVGYPFTLEQILEIIKVIAKAIEWRILV